MNSTMASVSEEDEEFYFLDQFNFEKRECLAPTKKCSYMKYTKIPSFGFDVRLKSKPAAVLQQNPKVRRHVTIDTDVKDTTRSLKFSEASDNKKILEDIRKKIDKPAISIKRSEKKQPRKFWCSSNRATQADDKTLKSTDICEKKSSTSMKPCVKFTNNLPLFTAPYDDQTLVNEKNDMMGQSKSVPLPLKSTSSKTSLDQDVHKKKITNSQSLNLPSKKTGSKPQKLKLSKHTESIPSYNSVSTDPMSFEHIDIPMPDGRPAKRLLDDIAEDPPTDEATKRNDQAIQYRVASCDTAMQCKSNTKKRLTVDQFTNMDDFSVQHDFSTNTELLHVSVSTNTRRGVQHTSHTNTARDELHASTNTETNRWHAFTNTYREDNNACTNTVHDAVNAHTNTDKEIYCKETLTRATLFDSLNIPDVSLTFDKSVKYVGNSMSLPSLVSTDVNGTCASDLRLSHYPMSVVSVFKTVMQKREDKVFLPSFASQKSNESKRNGGNVISLNRLFEYNSHKLVSPSDIIGGIRLDNGLLSSDIISDQFRMELNFIDSFFDSLRYLENCSLSDKIMDCDIKSDNWKSCNSEFNHSEYHDFLSKLENNNQSYTMASKSLFLLNLLIRDEQRRARNLLFVLKMRENALKDFTKSQIIWLENRKKQDGTGISTLKKKQRGALLKLQHECGEMQRMRKALVALSEKRRAALLKTKRNIELKLNKDVGVDHLFRGKKKMRRLTSDRSNAPLKCFELSSSGCENSNSVKTASASPEPPPENNVMVDGGYLNIIFQDIKLPQIFSGGKQYEVSKDALNAILETNKAKREQGSMETSTPSTARSLVDEFFQYYHGMGKECSSKDTSECESQPECKEEVPKTPEDKLNYIDLILKDLKDDTVLPEGPLPVPAGADADADVIDCFNVDEMSTFNNSDNSYYTVSVVEGGNESRQSLEPSEDVKADSLSNVALQHSSVSLEMYNDIPADSEAEALRQQQIAIEKEIKALEQQQLIVREIPDKPPPPYTPPFEAKSRSPWRQTAKTPDPRVQEYLRKAISGGTLDTEDSFECFCYDYCQERMESQKERDNELPWETSHVHELKSLKVTTATDTMVMKKTSAALDEMFTVPPPAVVTGQTTRRVDHVDNILFNEWRRFEPQWTAFHVDENMVKNQVFNSIFDKVLSQTVDEYKRIVMGD